MAKVILKRFLSVLLCVSVFWCSFAVSAFADGVFDMIDNVGGYLYDYIQTLVDSGVVVATKAVETIDGIATEVFQLDKDNYEKVVSAAVSTPIPKNGQMVSTKDTTDNLLRLYCPDWGYADWYCQPYVVSGGNLFIYTSYFRLFYSDNKLCRECYTYSSSYSSADLVWSNKDFSNYQFLYIEGYISSPYYFYYRLRSANDVTQFNSYKSQIISYSYGDLRQFVGLSSSSFDSDNITDFGYYISRTPFYTNAVDPSSIPDNGSVIVPRNASSFGDLRVGTVGGSPDDNNGGNGSMNGNITVGGKIDVNVSVPDININVNGNGGNGGNGNSYSMPDTDFFESYLDNALEESTGIRKFIGDFFNTLPGQITELFCLSIVIAILCRILGR